MCVCVCRYVCVCLGMYVCMQCVLTIQFAQGHNEPRKNIPNNGPPVAPKTLSAICKASTFTFRIILR